MRSRSRPWRSILSAYDLKLLDYAKLFRERFMRVTVSLELEQAMDLGWQTHGRVFPPRGGCSCSRISWTSTSCRVTSGCNELNETRAAMARLPLNQTSLHEQSKRLASLSSASCRRST